MFYPALGLSACFMFSNGWNGHMESAVRFEVFRRVLVDCLRSRLYYERGGVNVVARRAVRRLCELATLSNHLHIQTTYPNLATQTAALDTTHSFAEYLETFLQHVLPLLKQTHPLPP
jgi:hypothetical protein